MSVPFIMQDMSSSTSTIMSHQRWWWTTITEHCFILLITTRMLFYGLLVVVFKRLDDTLPTCSSPQDVEAVLSFLCYETPDTLSFPPVLQNHLQIPSSVQWVTPKVTPGWTTGKQSRNWMASAFLIVGYGCSVWVDRISKGEKSFSNCMHTSYFIHHVVFPFHPHPSAPHTLLAFSLKSI